MSWLRWGVDLNKNNTLQRKVLLTNVAAPMGLVSLLIFDLVFLYEGSSPSRQAVILHLPFYLGFALIPWINRQGKSLAACLLLTVTAMGSVIFPMLVAFGTYYNHHHYFILFAVVPLAIFPSRYIKIVFALFLINLGSFLYFEYNGMPPAAELLAFDDTVAHGIRTLLSSMVIVTLMTFFWFFSTFAEKSERTLELISMTDMLTTLPNRRFFKEAYQHEVARNKRMGTTSSIAMLDIDHFKKVNDSYGHDAGDIVLKKVAQECRKNLRAGNVMARIGGEEFAILLPEATSTQAVEAMERIRKAVEMAEIKVGNRVLNITVSIGVSTVETGMSLEDAFKNVDLSLYEAKWGGRNRVAFNELSVAYSRSMSM
ncbi:MAG: GGDEF domain-containing protein [Gallionella sp.]